MRNPTNKNGKKFEKAVLNTFKILVNPETYYYEKYQQIYQNTELEELKKAKTLTVIRQNRNEKYYELFRLFLFTSLILGIISNFFINLGNTNFLPSNSFSFSDLVLILFLPFYFSLVIPAKLFYFLKLNNAFTDKLFQSILTFAYSIFFILLGLFIIRYIVFYLISRQKIKSEVLTSKIDEHQNKAKKYSIKISQLYNKL